MSHPTGRAELVAVAEAMLCGNLHLIEGCRRICSLRREVADADNPVFLAIRGAESETDHFPLGELRGKYAPDYLARLDAEMNRYLAEAGEDILTACREIIRVFGASTS